MKIRRRRKSTTRRRRSYKRNPFALNPKRRKRSSRRRFKRNPFSLKSLSPSGLFSGGVVKEAAGAVGSTFVSSFVLGKFGSYLPGSTNNFARAGYRLGLHFALAPLVSKFGGPDAGRGVKLAGFIAALTEILKPTNALGAQAAALNPLGVMPIQPVGDYVPRRLPGRALPPLRPLSAVNVEAFNAYN